MKRTNLVLDPQVLEEALRVSGERTYSRAVGRALEDFVRRARAGKILEPQGQGLWDGDLGAIDEIATCLPVVQEVLQGFGDERAFRKARPDEQCGDCPRPW